MKIKTSELKDTALDWAVEMVECEGAMYSWRECRPFSIDWSVGGPIIEREGIALDQLRSSGVVESWVAAVVTTDVEFDGFKRTEEYGPRPLIAAMRCFVASRLGDEVDVPEELKGETK